MNETYLDRQLPQSRDSERAVLGAILINPQTLDRVAPILTAESFFKDSHRAIFRAIWDLAIRGIEIDFLTLREELSNRKQLDYVGGTVYISSLTDVVPDVANVETYARQVQEKASLREIVHASNAAMRAAFDGEVSVAVAAELTHRMARLGVTEARESRGIYTVVCEVRAEADRRAEAGEMVGVQTGSTKLDEMTLGIPREGLSVLGARSSHGKTTYAVNLALSALEARESTRIVLYSLEMSRQAITDTLSAKLSGIPLLAIRDWKNLNAMDRARVIEAQGYLAKFNSRFFFADRISTIGELVADARKRHQEVGLGLIVVDYLQLVEGLDEETRERTVNQIAWQLSELSKDLKSATLALSQVTVNADQRKDGRLSIDDLRDSKAIGHHARLVLLMSRPWQSNKARTDVFPCHTLLQVEKQSQGPTGDIALHFDGAFQDFREGTCNNECRYSRKAGHVCEECSRLAATG